ncbi:histone deacetylase family protein [Rhodobacteraceae bacterium 10Alg 79]|uniref:Histone deacetylase family protein n=2 Tax=Rhodalgimonas zhirmunskyi TaxID=2964767 RepID=A0AAJ1X560_9RHOB|nr:histone deacetylase family protein [Rhodoalgimonas zhirmunskyi]MDQ2094221.1 histone deacetylase family protein [Rhodoalgimonas zhirmunskyi]
MTGLFMHDDCLNHITPEGHAEQVARMTSVSAALEPVSGLDRREAPLCEEADILLCHPEGYLAKIRDGKPAQLDEDTWQSEGSYQAARRAVGGALAAVDAVLAGEMKNAFVACRPPGHHAETAKPMGFCLFGTAAIAAKHALERHGLSRVAVVDFDVHHGNGTQDLLWDEPRAFLATSQQFPLWPGTGAADVKGGHDNVLNVPLAPKTTGAEMREAYEAQVFPRLEAFAPELILISAGFDAHRADPLAQLEWETEDFMWLTERLCGVAETVCGGRVVSLLEGGYDLDALGESAAAHVRALQAA